MLDKRKNRANTSDNSITEEKEMSSSAAPAPIVNPRLAKIAKQMEQNEKRLVVGIREALSDSKTFTSNEVKMRLKKRA